MSKVFRQLSELSGLCRQMGERGVFFALRYNHIAQEFAMEVYFPCAIYLVHLRENGLLAQRYQISESMGIVEGAKQAVGDHNKELEVDESCSLKVMKLLAKELIAAGVWFFPVEQTNEDLFAFEAHTPSAVFEFNYDFTVGSWASKYILASSDDTLDALLAEIDQEQPANVKTARSMQRDMFSGGE